MDNRYDNQQEELLNRIVGGLKLRVFPCTLNEKKPANSGWQRIASNDPARVTQWFSLELSNYGVLCGTEHNGRYLTVVDVDCKKRKKGDESWAALTSDIAPDRLNKFTVQTPSGSRHYYFQSKEQFGNRTDVRDGIDLRGNGGFVVGPGLLSI